MGSRCWRVNHANDRSRLMDLQWMLSILMALCKSKVCQSCYYSIVISDLQSIWFYLPFFESVLQNMQLRKLRLKFSTRNKSLSIVLKIILFCILMFVVSINMFLSILSSTFQNINISILVKVNFSF